MRGLELPDLESGVEGEFPVAEIEDVPVEGTCSRGGTGPDELERRLDPGREWEHARVLKVGPAGIRDGG